MTASLEDIPQQWIKNYVDRLLTIVKELEPGRMRDAVLLRAEHAMDLVQAYRERER